MNAHMSDKTFEILSRSEERKFTNHYAPSIIWRNNQREIVPLRFNLLPNFSKENRYTMIDHQTGRKKEIKTYNAKIETIEERKTYKNLFGRFHCIVPILSFYEWVQKEGQKKREGHFSLENQQELLFAAGIWDHWINPQDPNEVINSFSLLTKEARKEVREAGHHRSPILLNEEAINRWIKPQFKRKSELYKILEDEMPKELKFTEI